MTALVEIVGAERAEELLRPVRETGAAYEKRSEELRVHEAPTPTTSRATFRSAVDVMIMPAGHQSIMVLQARTRLAATR
jgi:hypothetical protein